jgi:hypothetical protein
MYSNTVSFSGCKEGRNKIVFSVHEGDGCNNIEDKLTIQSSNSELALAFSAIERFDTNRIS